MEASNARKLIAFILYTSFLLPATALAQRPIYPYTHSELVSLNDNTQFPCGYGGTPTAQIASALSALGNAGVLDLTCYTSNILITQDLFSSLTGAITVILPPVQVTIAANSTIPANVTLVYQAGSVLAAGVGYVLANNASPNLFPNSYNYELQLTGAPTLTPTTGGALSHITYYYVITALTAAGGQTQAGAEAFVTLGAPNNAVGLAWTAVTGAASYQIYRGTLSAGENVYYSSATNSFTDVGGTSTAASPPLSNTAFIMTSGGTPGSPTNSMQMNLNGIFVGTPLYYGIAYDGSTPQTGAFSFLPAADAPVSITGFAGGTGNLFNVYMQNGSHVKTLAAYFDVSGNLFASTFTGNLTGNATTATALAATPNQCQTGALANGIAASGNANCLPASPPAVNGFYLLSESVTGSAAVAPATVASNALPAGTSIGSLDGNNPALTFSASAITSSQVIAAPSLSLTATGPGVFYVVRGPLSGAVLSGNGSSLLPACGPLRLVNCRTKTVN